MQTLFNALVVDDEEDLCTLMRMSLKRLGGQVTTALCYQDAKQLLETQRFDFCLTDMNLPDGNGMDLVTLVAEHYPSMPIAVITAYGSTDLAVEAMRLGAFDFVNKPIELKRLKSLVENALKAAKTQSSDTDPATTKLIGASAAMNQVRATIKKLARSQAPVFLRGESGTGKEVAARLIHELGPRSAEPFIAVNCGAIPAELMESQFFGHLKGSFTGAVSNKKGFFEAASGGTLFLDEVADLPLAMQVKLLRALQEKKVRPIGAAQETDVDVRLISATHKPIEALMESGDFREDLFYRIHVVDLCMPPLRSRLGDVPLLAEAFLKKIAQDWGLEQTPTLQPEALDALCNYSFPGNVRELRNLLERALTLSDNGQICHSEIELRAAGQAAHAQNQPQNSGHAAGLKPSLGAPASAQATESRLKHNHEHNQEHADAEPANPAALEAKSFDSDSHASKTAQALDSTHSVQQTPKQSAASDALPNQGLEEHLIQEETRLIMAAIELSGGNRTKAAELLQMSFRSLRYRIKKLGIDELL